MSTPTEDFKKFLEELCVESGKVIAPYFLSPDVHVEKKADASEVTVADRSAELYLREKISKRFPEHGILGEEFGSERKDAEYVWVIDPIDGTRAFVHGVPLFTTLIALLRDGEPILGAIHQPTIHALCIGDGKTTTLNGKRVAVRKTNSIEESSLLNTSPAEIGKYWPRKGFDSLVSKSKIFRTWGDGYGYLAVACGYADIMIDPIMNPWDILPLIPVIRGAGGTITTWDGKSPVTGRSAVATNGILHAKVLEMINS